MQSLARLSGILAVCSTAAVFACSPDGATFGETTSAITVPSGFSQAVVATGVSEPTALTFTPDGVMLVTSRGGKVRVVKNGSLLSSPAIDLGSRVCPQRERGLLGIAVDPDFASNRHVYLFYTAKKANCDLHSTSGAINRVSRFTYNTSTDKLSGETVLVDHILSYNGWHNGGDLQFGRDGYLYIGVGDSGAKLGTTSTGWGNDNSRFKSLLSGKVLRVQKTNGAPAPGNPWLSAAGSRRCGDPNAAPEFPRDNNRPCQETFAWGLRNPFRIPFKPGTSDFFINEVGQNIGGDWEEINQGRSGADYGWNRNQGPDVDGSTQAPVYAYEIGEEVGGSACRSITAGTFIPDGTWPNAYEGGYLFGDYVCGVIFYIKRENNRWVRRTFATGLGGSSIVHMAFGPGPNGTTAMYYTSFNGSKIVRVTGPAGSTNPSPPTAIVSASRTSGPTPLTVTFDGGDSFDNDPNDGIARYIWNFGDGSANQTTTSPTVSHTYAASGRFTARLTVEDRRTPTRQGTTTIEIRAGDTPPRVTITAPSTSKQFFVGEAITLSATATDTQDGTLPASALFWDVRKVHDDHTHPYLSQAGNNLTFVPDGPEGLEAAHESHFLIKVTATDSAGLTAEVEQQLQPRRVQVTFNTAPAGLRVRVEDTDLVGPTTITSWHGWGLHVDARPQVRNGTTYVWDRWSQGGGATQEIRTPGEAAAYTATFRASAFSAKINFQLGSAVVPTGYLEDDGAAFGDRGGGLRYGWDLDNQAAARERNNPAAPDKRYDTTILMQKTANRRWDIEVPNGTYQVKLVAGDADHFDSVFDITAEGRSFLRGTPTTGTRWIEANATVTVSDGRLTLDNGATARNNKVCFVEITETTAAPAVRERVNFQLRGSPTHPGYLADDGAIFGDRGGGKSYGWSADNTGAARDRNNPAAADQRYDTTVLFQKFGDYHWEMALPNGTYRIKLVAGDADHFDSVYDITAEGTTVLSGVPTTGNRWLEATATVTVSDGRLTLDNGPTARNNRICYLDIDSL